MASNKYGRYIKKLKFEKGKNGPKGIASPDYRTRMTGKDLEGIKLLFGWGYMNKTGMLGGGEGAHTSPAGEILLFTGLDYDHPGGLGAEIEIEMGPEGEKHVFNTPTIVIAPAGFPHGPLIIQKTDKSFAYLGIYLDAEISQKMQKREKAIPAAGMKYAHLVKKMEMRHATRNMGGNAEFIAAWNGKNMEGFELNFTWAFHSGLGAWHGGKDPHTHPRDEALLFVGLDPERPDYLGAEIEIAMGKEQEKHVFDYPAVIVAPAGFVHCPLVTRRVDKPYAFSAISLNAEHQTTWLGTGKFPWEQ
jgi:hypothetical protein